MNHNVLKCLGIFMSVVISVGCDSYATKTEQQFGESVRTMVDRQKVAVEPTQGMGMDGVKTEQVLETYRKDVSKPAEIKNEIQINVGTE